MENKMQVFNNKQFGQVRIEMDGDSPLFCGSDVAKALGYARPRDAIAAHAKGAVKSRTLTNGGRTGACVYSRRRRLPPDSSQQASVR